MTDVPATFLGPSADWEPWIGYIRVSTWREEKISPEIQRAAIEQWARRTRRRIVAWIEDLDATGRNFKRRIMQGIEAVERREARGIAVWKFSRFGRTDVGIAINLERLEHVGGALASATEEIDASTAVGRFNRAILFDLAVFESNRIGEQWKETHAHRLAHGVPAGGRPRFGYLWTPRRSPDAEAPTGWRVQEETYEPNYPRGADALAEAYEQYATGTGFITLADMLNQLGHKTTRGGTWRQDSLLRYMDSGFAAGLLRVRDACDCGKNGRTHKSCGHWRLFPGAHEPVITPEVWEEYRGRRGQVRRMPPRERAPRYETTGLVRCSLCRGALTGHPKRDGAVYWRCARADAGGDCTGTTATYTDLQHLVLCFLADVADGIDRSPAAALREPSRPDPAAERARLTAEHDQARAALTRLVVDYARHPERYPAEAYDAARAALEADAERALGALAELEAQPAPLPTLADFRPLVIGALPEWEVMTPQQRNGLLRQVIREVRVYPRTSRTQTAARIVPVWEPLDAADPGPTATLEAIPDGIAYKTSDEDGRRKRR